MVSKMLKPVLIAAVLAVAVLSLQVHSAPVDFKFGHHITRSVVNQPMNETQPVATVCEFNSVMEILRKNATLVEAVREALSPNRGRGQAISVDYLHVFLNEENATQEEWIWSRSIISLHLPPRFAFTGLFNFGWWPNINEEPNITLRIPHLCTERRDYLQECLVEKLQLLAADGIYDGSNTVDSSPSVYSLKVGSNGTQITNEGISPDDAREILTPLVYMFVTVIVCFRCKALYNGDAWFYKRKDVKDKMKDPCAWCCTSNPDSSAIQEDAQELLRNEDKNNDDETTPVIEAHTSKGNVIDKKLMKNMSIILAFKLLATLLSLILAYEMTVYYLEVYHNEFTNLVAIASLCLWVAALLSLAIVVVCYACKQRCRPNQQHFSPWDICCYLPIFCSNCEIWCCWAIPLSPIVDIILSIGTIHFTAYIASVSLLFLLATFLRNWLLTFYIAITNVSCFIILLVALSEVTHPFFKLKLDKSTPRPKKRLIMAVLHRAAVVLLFITLSIAVGIIYFQPHMFNNHLSASPMFTPVVAMAAAIVVIYTVWRKYHIFPFNKDVKKYITEEKE